MTASNETEWLANAEEDGTLRFRLGRRGDEVIAEWLGVATLVASRDGARSSLTFDEGVSAMQRDKIRRGGARILLGQLRGELGLHGSAVAFHGRALAFVGASGHGKSTLAAALCARGGTLLADDAVALAVSTTSTNVEPTEEIHWLDAAACGALALPPPSAELVKAPIAARRGASTPVALVAIVELAWGGSVPVLDEPGPVESIARLLPHLGRILVDSPASHLHELEQLTRLFANVPFYTLTRPMAFEALPATVDRLIALCSKAHADDDKHAQRDR